MSHKSDETQSSYETEDSATSTRSYWPEEGLWNAQETVPKTPISVGVSAPLSEKGETPNHGHRKPKSSKTHSSYWTTGSATSSTGGNGPKEGLWNAQQTVIRSGGVSAPVGDTHMTPNHGTMEKSRSHISNAILNPPVLATRRRQVSQSQRTDSHVSQGSLDRRTSTESGLSRVRIPSGDLGSLYESHGGSKRSSSVSNVGSRAFEGSLDSDSFPENPEPRNRASNHKSQGHHKIEKNFPKFSFKKFDGKFCIPDEFKGRVEFEQFKGVFEVTQSSQVGQPSFWRQPLDLSTAHVQWMIIIFIFMNLLLILVVISQLLL